jgi:hypothetical protein
MTPEQTFALAYRSSIVGPKCKDGLPVWGRVERRLAANVTLQC